MFAQNLKQALVKVVFQGLLKINGTISQYIYENYLKRRSKMHGQAGMGSCLVCFWVLKKFPQKDLTILSC